MCFRFVPVFLLILLVSIQSPLAYAQDEIIRYRLTKTVLDNGKTEDLSGSNQTRYYRFRDEEGHKVLTVTNSEGRPMAYITPPSKKEQNRWKLGLTDSPWRELLIFVLQESEPDHYVYRLDDPTILIRVSKDRSLINVRYRKNRLKNTYATDVWVRDDGSQTGSALIR